MYWAGQRDGVLYRQAVLNWKTQGGPPLVDLADAALSQGLLRVDRPRVYHAGELRACHYGLPHVQGPAQVERRTVRGLPALTARIPGRQLALVAVLGWDRLDAATHRGFHPEAEESTLLFASAAGSDRYPTMGPKILLMLHKTDDTPWTDAELLPLKTWRSDGGTSPALDAVVIELSDGQEKRIDFAGQEGRLSL
jgi:hypothetical protein